jgi:chromosome segregation ATPase
VRKGRALEEERNRALEAVEALRQRAASPGAVMGSPPVRTTVDLQCASLEADLNVARQQLEWLQEANDKVVKATREDLQDHRQQVADLQLEVDEATRQADVASEARAVLELELGNKLAALQESSAREAALQADLNANEQKLVDVNAELRSLTVKLAAVEFDGSASLEGLQSEMTTVQAEIKVLREEKEALKVELGQLQATLDGQEARVEEMETALVEARRYGDDNQLQSQVRH